LATTKTEEKTMAASAVIGVSLEDGPWLIPCTL
jgi:hypothetical protein